MATYELHTHCRFDLNDSGLEPDALCERLVEMGAKKFASTSHGVMSGAEPMKEAAERHGLGFIYGIEAYYGNKGEDLRDNQHLIILACDEIGYKALIQAVSNSQNSEGCAVMNRDILAKYFGNGTPGHGHVIATSACINGVVAAKLRANEVLQREIAKAEAKLSDFLPYKQQIASDNEQIAKLEAELAEIQKEIDTTKKLAEMKFVAREKSVEKLKGTEGYEEAKASFDADKKASEEAAKKLPDIKKKATSIKTRISSYKKSASEANGKLKTVMATQEKHDALVGMLKGSDELYSDAVNTAKEMVDIFGENNFYMEVQNHGIDIEADIYPVLVKIARELNIPLVASNDVHTVGNTPDELLQRQILRSLRFKKWEEQMPGDDQLYVKTDEEMVDWLSDILDPAAVEEAMANTKVIADRCSSDFEAENHYPVFPSESGQSSNKMLLEAIKEGVKWRFPDGIPQEYKDRINYEYKIITQMGYADYHLIVKDFLEYGRALSPVPDEYIDQAPLSISEVREWVKENGWEGGFTIGPGRGSGAGSLVCYVLGITSIDPMKYDLLFERFLNPERISMPDIDSDIANRIRGKVVEYVEHKYGEEAVCGIMTTNAIGPRGAIRNAAKYYGLSIDRDGEFLSLSDEMAKKCPGMPGTTFKTETEHGDVESMLKAEYADNPDALNIIRWATLLEGAFISYGAHAAGVVISDGNPVSNYIPLRWNSKLGEMTTQVDMNRVEAKGLIKMDFLGLKTLDILTDAIRMIKQRTGKVIDPLKDIDFEDDRVYNEIFANAKTNSVFQFESSGMKNMLKRFRPQCFEDLIILVSMYRPGPMQYLDSVIDVKNGRAELTYLCPELEPILGKTYGAVVYQEQVMEIFQKLAGYTLGGADQVRRYMSKKKKDKLAHEKEAFVHGDIERNIKGCVANGISEDVAYQLFDQLEDFSSYAFNKSHAAAYAFNSYITAWFKLYYPAEFLAAALKWAALDKYLGLMREADSFGIKILPPDINRSFASFSVTDDGNILFGMESVKSVGSNAAQIVKEREANGIYVSLEDFFERTDVNKAAVEALIRAGAFDAFGNNRASMADMIDTYKKCVNDRESKLALIDDLRKVLPYVNDVQTEEELAALRNELGVSEASLPKVTTSAKVERRIVNAEKSLKAAEDTLAGLTVATSEELMQDRLAKEKELLGFYISGHPLDDYDDAKAYGALTISKAEERKSNGLNGPVSILAVVNSIEKRVSKKKVAYAVLEVEDKTGIVDLFLFNDAYDKFKDKVAEGEVFKFTGSMKEETYETDEGETKVSYRMFGSDVKSVARKSKDVLICADKKSDAVKAVAEVPDTAGRKAIIYSKEDDRLEPAPFRVSEDALKNGANEI